MGIDISKFSNNNDTAATNNNDHSKCTRSTTR